MMPADRLNPDVAYEKRSLAMGMWANLLMGLAGLAVAKLSNSDALLVDGLYSGVNFFSALIASRVAESVMKPADKRMPFGYDANEALYVLFRSLVLLGIFAFAGVTSLNKITTYLAGGEVPSLKLGPIVIYMGFIIIACFGLALWHHWHFKKTGSRSEILRTERMASMVDGVISIGVGGALLGVTFLEGTPFEGVIPVSDAIIVLILVVAMIGQPYGMFRGAFKDISGEAVCEETTKKVQRRIEEVIGNAPCELLAVAVTKLGRTHFAIVYIRPEDSVVASDMDALRGEIHASYEDLFPRLKTEVIYTATKPF